MIYNGKRKPTDGRMQAPSTRIASAPVVALAATLVALMMPLPVGAAEDSAVWASVLRLQLQDNNNCRMEKVLFARELQLGGETGLEGRIRCIDGREYDFTRQRRHEKFDIRLCQPTVC